MEQAFNPLGVYQNFWHPTVVQREPHDYTVAMVNDEDRSRTGKLRLVFTDAKGQEGIASEIPFSLELLGAQSYAFALNAPAIAGKYLLQAIAVPGDDSNHRTISHRAVSVLPGTTKGAE